MVDPQVMGLLPLPPKCLHSATSRSTDSLSHGNLEVRLDRSTGLVQAWRISDRRLLLNMTGLTFSRPQVLVTSNLSVESLVEFGGHGAEEEIYGLGEHRTGRVNQMPFFKDFAESQVYGKSHGADAMIPWYMSSMGFGFLWNLPSYGNVSITPEKVSWFSAASLNVDFWITTTPSSSLSYPSLLHRFVDAVGHAPAMPFYSTGFIQSKNRYRRQEQVVEVARGYRSRGLPISVIVVDFYHWVHQGDWSFDPRCWPDPAAMVKELQQLGIELMVTFWPFQTRESSHWLEFSSEGYLATLTNGTLKSFDFGEQYLYDPFNPAARQATFRGFEAGYGQYGIRTIWLDAAEPERPTTETVGSFLFSGGTDSEVGAAWVQHHMRTFSEGMSGRGVSPEEFLLLPRHAWTGSWRYSAALWSGDVPSTFQELELQVRVLQGVMLSGVALWTTDIGGYSGGDPEDPVFQELIVRWFQFGAFCPLFRLHGERKGGPPADECGDTGGDNEVWTLAQDPQHYQALADVMGLRESLRDYVAELNKETSATGLPMVRPVFLQFPEDLLCRGEEVEAQFLLGPDWLVAPVTRARAGQWRVCLPLLVEGQVWRYHYNQSRLYRGGQWLDMDTSITQFPLFKRISQDHKP